MCVRGCVVKGYHDSSKCVSRSAKRRLDWRSERCTAPRLPPWNIKLYVQAKWKILYSLSRNRGTVSTDHPSYLLSLKGPFFYQRNLDNDIKQRLAWFSFKPYDANAPRPVIFHSKLAESNCLAHEGNQYRDREIFINPVLDVTLGRLIVSVHI